MGNRLDDPFAAAPSAGERFALRRTIPRYSLIWLVEILEPISRTSFTVQTTKVSIRGCCVSTVNPLDRGTIVRMKIWRREETVDVWARVTDTSADGRMGLAFLANGHQEVIARWISAEIQTQSPPLK